MSRHEKETVMKCSCFAIIWALLTSGIVQAAPFNPLSVDVGGDLPGYDGPGIRVDAGGFFVADGAGSHVSVGSATNFSAENEQEFDSHYTIDQRGPSARNRAASPQHNSNATLNFYGDYGPPGGSAADYNEAETIPGAFLFINPGTHIGDALGDGNEPEDAAEGGYFIVPPSVKSGFAPNPEGGRSEFDGVFIARLTIKAGAVLSGGVFFAVLVEPGVYDNRTILVGGPAVMFQTSTTERQELALRAYRVTTVELSNPSLATAAGYNDGTPFGMADVYDLWVQTVPASGTLCLGPLFLLVSVSRRRARVA
jgi:hypothetical protein